MFLINEQIVHLIDFMHMPSSDVIWSNHRYGQHCGHLLERIDLDDVTTHRDEKMCLQEEIVSEQL